MYRCIMVLTLTGTLLAGTAGAATPGRGLIDHGVAVPLAERRGVVVTRDRRGRNLVIGCSLDLSLRGWILVTDIDSGETTQVFGPEGVANAPPYGSLLARSGKFYTSQGRVLLEFDPAQGDWTFHGVPSPGASAYLRIVEGPDGTVWLGDVYRAGLASFEPQARRMRDHGRLDEQEKYLSHVAVDDAGWVYGGIGTARCNIVAYHPTTGDKQQIVPEAQRKVGTATVYRGVDGKVYGKAGLTDGTQCWRLFAGNAEPIAEADMGKTAPRGDIYWGDMMREFPDGRQLTGYNLEEKWLEVRDPATKAVRRIPLEYESEGTHLRVITAGPDGRVWGNSAHPSRGVVYDPRIDRLEYFPGAIALKGYGVQGPYVFGGHYGGGKLYVLDTTEPWNMVPTATAVKDGIEAAELLTVAHSDEGRLDLIASHPLVLFRAEKYGGQAHFELETRQAGPHYVIVAPYRSPGYCTVQFLLDGQPLGAPYHGHAPGVATGPLQVLGPVPLAAGKHRLSVQTIETEAGNPWIGIRAVALTPTPPDEAIATARPANPRLVAEFAPDINVPWGACAHPDGKHILISGLPGYGYLGGGIGIYNLDTGAKQLLPHTSLAPNHSVMAMVPLENGDILCATSVAGGHGTSAVDTDAVLFLLDWKQKSVRFRIVPIPGAREIGLLCRGRDGRVYGVADRLFVFDPVQRAVTHTAELKAYGPRAVNGMAAGTDGNIYLVMQKAVLCIRPSIDGFAVEKIADTPGPAGAGIAVVDGRVYFGVGSRLWSVAIP